MLYQWDNNKAEINRLKHGVDFADAVSVFANDAAITVVDDHPDEERFATMGIDTLGRILVVIYTWRNNDIRLISARKATRSERRQYED